MEDQLKQYLKEFVETLKQGGEFAQEQLPLFVKEYLTWGFWEAIVLSIVFLLFTIGGLVLGKYIYKKLKENDPFDEFGYVFGIVISCFASICAFIGMVTHIMTAIKITVAPRVYLIENLMNLL